MFSIETTWIIPTILVFILIAMLLIFYIIISHDFLLDEERAYLQQAGGQVTSSDQVVHEVSIDVKNRIVLTQSVLKSEKKWVNPFASIVGKSILETSFTFKKMNINYLKMGLIKKYGEEWFEKKG